ncbi:MAG TPA: hypothetical protein VJM32_01005 [Candidatus Saccharimonadales bacterium]|nr:hypothetical protein [Candidatus Saccharimonadales bacterium]
MGLLDDLLGPIRDLASVKDDVMNEVGQLGDVVQEVKSPVDEQSGEDTLK